LTDYRLCTALHFFRGDPTKDKQQNTGLLPIEWVIFWNLSVIPVFNGDAMADR